VARFGPDARRRPACRRPRMWRQSAADMADFPMPGDDQPAARRPGSFRRRTMGSASASLTAGGKAPKYRLASVSERDAAPIQSADARADFSRRFVNVAYRLDIRELSAWNVWNSGR